MFRFDNSYARLPGRFFESATSAPASAPRQLKVNRGLAVQLGVDPDTLESAAGTQVLAGNAVPEGAEPIALAYAGHQFGAFVPRLGDGRAILLGEIVGADGARRDVQLKGAGRTSFSRGGDGRAALGPVMREYVVSEAMASMGIPTTRALAAIVTGDPVFRETPLPGAVLTRVASSHIRIGTFQYFAARNDLEALQVLASYARARHFPGPEGAGRDATALLEAVIDAQAKLVARWLGVGFIHGVMNTDNTTISGETLDYGPCAFLDAYDPAKKYSSIDTMGRYAFGRQPHILLWNLTRLAEALLPVLADDAQEAVRIAEERLTRFPSIFEAAYLAVLRAKLGLGAREDEAQADGDLAEDLLERLAANTVDHTLFFRRLCASAEDPAADREAAALFAHPGAFHDWASRWRARLALDDVGTESRAAAMRAHNPKFIPRNHLIEEAIVAAVERKDHGPFEALLEVVTHPFDEWADRKDLARYAVPPRPEEEVTATFCGT